MLISPDVKSEHYAKVTELHSRVKDLAESGYRELRASKSNYFDQFEFLIHDEWFFKLPYHSFETSLVLQSKAAFPDALQEDASDQCMLSLVGSKENITQKPCMIDNDCWALMFAKAVGGYHLTHQALFAMLAEQHGKS